MSQWAMRDNAGGIWTKGVKEFLKIYCEDWKTRQEIQFALFESLNVWSSKTDEILQSLWGIGMIQFDRDKGYKWSDKPIDPLIKLAKEAFDKQTHNITDLKIKEKEPEKLSPEEEVKKAEEMKLYRETKSKLEQEEKGETPQKAAEGGLPSISDQSNLQRPETG